MKTTTPTHSLYDKHSVECPWCLEEQDDSYPKPNEEFENECQSCEKKFTVFGEVRYSMERVCEDHDWETVENIFTDSEWQDYRCKICLKSKYERKTKPQAVQG